MARVAINNAIPFSHEPCERLSIFEQALGAIGQYENHKNPADEKLYLEWAPRTRKEPSSYSSSRPQLIAGNQNIPNSLSGRLLFEKKASTPIMAQIFSRNANVYARVTILGFVVLACGAGWATSTIYWSPYTTEVDVPLQQPIPFSHKHHVADDGIDCRYCHTSVEKSSFAGIPPTETCMTCHSQIWTDAPVLASLRESLATGKPLKWVRVDDLPGYVYFNHSVHVAKGIGCANCHGRVDRMPLTRKAQTLYMRWCLECHENPQKFIRPRDKVFDVAWRAPPNQQEEGQKLVSQYHVDTTGRIINCSTCHR